jgi:hypothetical protein
VSWNYNQLLSGFNWKHFVLGSHSKFVFKVMWTLGSMLRYLSVWIKTHCVGGSSIKHNPAPKQDIFYLYMTQLRILQSEWQKQQAAKCSCHESIVRLQKLILRHCFIRCTRMLIINAYKFFPFKEDLRFSRRWARRWLYCGLQRRVDWYEFDGTMTAVRTHETLVTSHQSTRSYKPEDSHLLLIYIQSPRFYCNSWDALFYKEKKYLRLAVS